MPFAYYRRLTRAQQAIYRRSDEITEVRLPRPAALHPAVDALEQALGSEERRTVQAATERLIRGLTDAVAVSAVRAEVLAARPHARWGELHGLYTAERGQAPRIQLWMRTARQKRVVAFRTYLRTLLHEVGHHFDYALLRLRDSYHTEGFYKRESSLFHQLVPERGPAARSVEDWFRQSPEARLARLARTPDEVARALAGHGPPARARRAGAWAPVEIVCILRDAERLFQDRFETILTREEPRLEATTPPERWPEERAYLGEDVSTAVADFCRRRSATLARLAGLAPDAWQRGGVHPQRGRLTIDDLVAMMAWHDEHRLEQLADAPGGGT